MTWTKAFVQDVAMRRMGSGVSWSELAERHGMEVGEMVAVCGTGLFKRDLAKLEEEWSEEHRPIRLKAAAIAEDTLPEIHSLIKDREVGPSVRVRAHEHMSKLAGAMPKEGSDGDGGSGVKVEINFGSQSLEREVPPIEGAVIDRGAAFIRELDRAKGHHGG